MTQQSSPQHQLDFDPPRKTLLGELAEIDDAHAHGAVTPEQEKRAAEIVELCNSAEQMKVEIDRLTKELSSQRSYTKYIEKEAHKQHRQFWAYKTIDDLYKSLKRDAESDAQEPFDDHYRECLYALYAIANDPASCTCQARGWHGEGHDSQCPIRIATDAPDRASAVWSKAMKERNPSLYRNGKGSEA
jgi:hypothetical protein